MDTDNQKTVDPADEAKFYQDYLDNEDDELDRLNNAVWPEEIVVGIIFASVIGAIVYYFFG